MQKNTRVYELMEKTIKQIMEAVVKLNKKGSMPLSILEIASYIDKDYPKVYHGILKLEEEGKIIRRGSRKLIYLNEE